MANVFENVIGGLWHGVERGGQGLNGGIQHVGRNLGNSLGSVWNDTIGSKGLFNAFDNWYGGSGGEAATKLGLGAIAGFGIGGAAAGGELGAGAGEGAGGYTVLEGMPQLGDGLEGGAFDMYGSQSSPTDASTVFDGTGGMSSASSGSNQYQTSSSQRRSSGQQSYEPEQQDYLGHGLNPYTRHALDASNALGSSGPNYWMSRADQLRLLAQHVADQLYGARA